MTSSVTLINLLTLICSFGAALSKSLQARQTNFITQDILHQQNKEFLSEVPTTSPTPVPYIVNITSVNITWTTVTTPTHFIVQCKSQDFSDSDFHNVSGLLNSTYFVYNQMKNPSYYIFRLLVITNGTITQTSTNTDIFINGATAPTGPPMNLQVLSVTSTTIRLNWANTPPGVDRAYTYHMFLGTNPNNLTEVDVIDNMDVYTFVNLQRDTQYYIAVQADIGGIKSILSNIISQATLGELLPLTLAVSCYNYTSVNISWNSSSDIFITQYVVHYTVLSADREIDTNIQNQSVTISSGVSSFLLTGLEEGATYLATISYQVNGFWSKGSSPVQFKLPSSVLCTSCIGISSSEMLIQWKTNHVSFPVEYFIYSSTCSNFTQTSTNHSVSVVIGNNTAWTQCNYSVTVLTPYNGCLIIPSTCPTTHCITNQAKPSGHPVNFTVLNVSSRSVTLEWAPIPAKEQNGPIIFYVVICTSCSDTIYEFRGLRGIVQPLIPNTNYSFVVRAQNGVGLSPPTERVLLQTLQDRPTGGPCNPTLLYVNYSTASISWSPPLLNQQNGFIVQYTVSYRSYEGPSQCLNVTDTNITLTNLQPNTTYYIKVKAWTIVGSGPYSPIINFSTLNDYVPLLNLSHIPEIDHFSIVTKGHSVNYCFTVLLTWDFNKTSNLILDQLYITYWTTNSSDTLIHLRTNDRQMILTSETLSAGTNYTFELSARFNFGSNSTYNLIESSSIITPGCSGVITLVAVVTVLLSVLLLIILLTIIICCVCLKSRPKQERHGVPPLHLRDIHQSTSVPNEYMTMVRDNRGDGQSSEDTSSSINTPNSLNVYNNNNRSTSTSLESIVDESSPLIIRTSNPTFSYYQPVLIQSQELISFQRNSDGYLVPTVRRDVSIASDLSGRYIPDGSSISSSLLSLSSAPP